MASFSLVVLGIAWCEPVSGSGFQGWAPVLAALALADESHLLPGAVTITGAIANQLSASTDPSIRQWSQLSAEERLVSQELHSARSVGRFDQKGRGDQTGYSRAILRRKELQSSS